MLSLIFAALLEMWPCLLLGLIFKTCRILTVRSSTSTLSDWGFESFLLHWLPFFIHTFICLFLVSLWLQTCFVRWTLMHIFSPLGPSRLISIHVFFLSFIQPLFIICIENDESRESDFTWKSILNGEENGSCVACSALLLVDCNVTVAFWRGSWLYF